MGKREKKSSSPYRAASSSFHHLTAPHGAFGCLALGRLGRWTEEFVLDLRQRHHRAASTDSRVSGIRYWGCGQEECPQSCLRAAIIPGRQKNSIHCQPQCANGISCLEFSSQRLPAPGQRGKGRAQRLPGGWERHLGCACSFGDTRNSSIAFGSTVPRRCGMGSVWLLREALRDRAGFWLEALFPCKGSDGRAPNCARSLLLLLKSILMCCHPARRLCSQPGSAQCRPWEAACVQREAGAGAGLARQAASGLALLRGFSLKGALN